MSVDGIGSGGRPPKAGEQAPVGSDPVEAPSGFGAEQAADAAPADPPSALDQVRSGALSVDQYVEMRVERAVAHLKPTLPNRELEFVRESLRHQMRSDPVLIELLQRATGARSAESDI